MDTKDSSACRSSRGPLDRRGFLRRAGTMAAGGVGAAALLKQVGLIPAAPMVTATDARPNAPYFFCIETMAGRTEVARAAKEV
jgi:hypothetical protein